DGNNRGSSEKPDAEDACNAHDADVLGISCLARAAENAADQRAQTVAHESAAQVAGEVALHDPADRINVTRVLRDEDDGDEPEQADFAAELAEVREAEAGHAKPGSAPDRSKSDVAAGLRIDAGGIEDGDDVADHDADQHRQ